jgi:hypothetical protein
MGLRGVRLIVHCQFPTGVASVGGQLVSGDISIQQYVLLELSITCAELMRLHGPEAARIFVTVAAEQTFTRAAACP